MGLAAIDEEEDLIVVDAVEKILITEAMEDLIEEVEAIPKDVEVILIEITTEAETLIVIGTTTDTEVARETTNSKMREALAVRPTE